MKQNKFTPEELEFFKSIGKEFPLNCEFINDVLKTKNISDINECIDDLSNILMENGLSENGNLNPYGLFIDNLISKIIRYRDEK